jgi:hypothetical protein
MVPVITAIVAGALATAAAFGREQWLRSHRFLVAARVVRALFQDAEGVIRVFVDPDDQRSSTWADVDEFSRMLDFVTSWNEHRDVLAGGLTRSEWDSVSTAFRGFVVATRFGGDKAATVSSSGTETLTLARDRLRKAVAILDPYCDRAGWWRNPGLKGRTPTVA